MRCHTWDEAEVGGMLPDILRHVSLNGPQVIRGMDGTDYVVVARQAYTALLERVGETAPAALPSRGATIAEIDAHLQEFCGVPLGITGPAAGA